jgi:hypothetical protein
MAIVSESKRFIRSPSCQKVIGELRSPKPRSVVDIGEGLSSLYRGYMVRKDHLLGHERSGPHCRCELPYAGYSDTLTCVFHEGFPADLAELQDSAYTDVQPSQGTLARPLSVRT